MVIAEKRIDKAVLEINKFLKPYFLEFRDEIFDFKNKIGIPLNSTIVSVSAAQSAGYCEYCTYDYGSDTAHIGHIIPKNNPRLAVINVAYI